MQGLHSSQQLVELQYFMVNHFKISSSKILDLPENSVDYTLIIHSCNVFCLVPPFTQQWNGQKHRKEIGFILAAFLYEFVLLEVFCANTKSHSRLSTVNHGLRCSRSSC